MRRRIESVAAKTFQPRVDHAPMGLHNRIGRLPPLTTVFAERVLTASLFASSSERSLVRMLYFMSKF